jgi:hypothetical protein
MRELMTIGDLGALGGVRDATPLGRAMARRYAVMGATIPGWSPPAAVNMNSVGVPLQNAAIALQNYLDASGIPAESVNDPNVAAFQTAWNADGVAGVAPIDVDGGYGPNTMAALNALTGEAAPAGGGAVVPGTPSAVIPGSSSSSSGFPWGTALLVGGLLVGGYFLFFRKKTARLSVTTHTNPRRGRRKKKNGKRAKKAKRR